MRTIIVWIGAVLMVGGLWSASAVSQGLTDEPAASSSSSEGTGGAAGNETGGSEAVPPVVEGEPTPSPEAGDVQERAVPRMPLDLGGASARSKPTVVQPMPAPGQPVQPLMAGGVPPPVGPPDPVAPIMDLGIDGILTAILKGNVDQILATVNSNLAKNPDVHARVTWSYERFGTYTSATDYSDRPNERFAKVPYMLHYSIDDITKHIGGAWVPYFGRKVFQDVDLKMFCDKWQTSQGHLKLVSDIGPLNLEPISNPLEQVLDAATMGYLINYINGQIQAQLRFIAINNVAVTLPGQCTSIGTDKHDQAVPTDDTITWSYQPPRTVVTQTILNQVTVKLQTLKRLTAHDLSGAALYKPVEAPALDFYANYQHSFVPLPPMQEGQQISLTAPPLMLNRPGATLPLVLIANVIQNISIGTQPTDSAYLVFGNDMNFGNGTRALRIRKSYWEPPKPPLTHKPTQYFVDAYELTLQIGAGQPGLSVDTNQTSTGTGGVSPGTVAPAIIAPIMRRGIEGEQPENSTVEPAEGSAPSDSGAPPPATP